MDIIFHNGDEMLDAFSGVTLIRVEKLLKHQTFVLLEINIQKESLSTKKGF